MIRNTLKQIKADAGRYDNWISQAGFWVTCSYRIRRLRKSSLRMMALLPIDILLGCIRWVTSDTQIPSSMAVGGGLFLPHAQGIFLNGKAIIEDNVAIFQQVTLGEWHNYAPVIKNNTAIYAGAKLFGKITIGENCKIGANTVVNVDIPANSSVSAQQNIIRNRLEPND
jgi:serine O-acetyltransferase